MVLLLLIAVSVFLLPREALAWGPGLHLQLGTAALAQLQTLPPAVAAVIGAFPNDFLYGCIAADITVGKKYTNYLRHCHRWQIGSQLLKEAKAPSQQACAWGYLTHLAADTIAHSYYVPMKIMQSFPTLMLKHAYWEMRFDTFVEPGIWDLGRKVALEHYEDNDTLLRQVLSNTIFSFGTNKRIFNSILLVSRLEKWQQLLQTVHDVSRFQLEEDDRCDYTDLAHAAVLELLHDSRTSPWLEADPTGERALKAAGSVRKNLMLLYRSGKITKGDANAQLKEIKSVFRAAIREPERLRHILSD
jgi:hypothetical protein